MAFPIPEGDLRLRPRAEEKAMIPMEKREPTKMPIFQGAISRSFERKLQEMKVAARQAGQGMERIQNVFREIS